MYTKIAINFILILILVVIQVSFISGLPYIFNQLNLVVVTLIFILGLISFKLSLWWALTAGILLDIFSFQIFGIFLVSTVVTVVAAHFLLNKIFTNRSLYSFLALILLSGVVYKIVLYTLSVLTNIARFNSGGFSLSRYFWEGEAAFLVINSLAVIVSFYFLSYISKNLKPAFLIKNK